MLPADKTAKELTVVVSNGRKANGSNGMDGGNGVGTSELDSEGVRREMGQGNAAASSCSGGQICENNRQNFMGTSPGSGSISTITNHSMDMKTSGGLIAGTAAGTSAQGAGSAEFGSGSGRESEAGLGELRELRIDVGHDLGSRCLSGGEGRGEVARSGANGGSREEKPEMGEHSGSGQPPSGARKTEELGGGCTTPLAEEQPQQGGSSSTSANASTSHLYPSLTVLTGHLSASQPEIGSQSGGVWSEVDAQNRDSSRSLERSDTLKAEQQAAEEEQPVKLVRVSSTGACPTTRPMIPPPAVPEQRKQLKEAGAGLNKVEPERGKADGVDKTAAGERPKFALGSVSPNPSVPEESRRSMEAAGVKSLKDGQHNALAVSVSSPAVVAAGTKKAAGAGMPSADALVSSSEATKEKAALPVVPPRTKKRRVTELKCSEVRWFYRRKLVETKWTPFAGCDSLMLEVYWRSKFGVDLDVQTTQHLSGNSALTANKIAVMDGLYTVADDAMTMIQAIYWKDDEMEIRRGTWFLVESLQPINPDMADPIEKHHLHVFRSQTIPDTPVFSEKETSRKPLLTELKLQDQYEVRWNSVIDTTLYNNSKTSRLFRYITWGKGTQLKRGYEEASWEDGKRKISHLIMVVHGIGQKGYENLIAKNSEQVRDAMYAVMEKHYPDEESRPMVLPVEWRSQLVLDNGVTDQVTLPKMSTMRHALNAIAMDIMYYQSPLYRNEIMAGLVRSLNTVYNLFISNHPDYDGPISLYAHSLGSVMCYDVLTSWSPLVLFDDYVAEAIDSHLSKSTTKDVAVLHEFQNARQKLLDHYGGFQKAFSNPNEQLNFKVTNLFCIGSPLAVFLIMRGATKVYPTGDRLKRIYNVFHPYDPVAYRLEPLIHTNYQLIKPVKLFTSIDLRALGDYDQLSLELHRSYIKKLKAREKREKESREKDLNNRLERGHEHEGGDHDGDDMIAEEDYDSDESSAQRPNSSCSSPRSLTPPPYETAAVEQQQQQRKGWWKFGGGGASKKEKEKETASSIEIAKEMEETKLNDLDRIIDEIPMEHRLLYRMDFQVQPQITDRSYWSVLKSHFAYWTNADIATFIVNQLYTKDKNGNEDDQPNDTSNSTNGNINSNVGKSNCNSNNNNNVDTSQDNMSKQSTGYTPVIGEVGSDVLS